VAHGIILKAQIFGLDVEAAAGKENFFPVVYYYDPDVEERLRKLLPVGDGRRFHHPGSAECIQIPGRGEESPRPEHLRFPGGGFFTPAQTGGCKVLSPAAANPKFGEFQATV